MNKSMLCIISAIIILILWIIYSVKSINNKIAIHKESGFPINWDFIINNINGIIAGLLLMAACIYKVFLLFEDEHIN